MPDPLIQDPASTQNFNRYSYCLNNPLKYTDESGEIVWLVPVIGAVIGVYIGYNSASKSNVTGWERIGYIAAGAAIGTVASLLASAVAAGISTIIAEAGIGGFAGGAITGSASGLVGGGVSGFGYKILDGGTLEEAFAAGGAGALSGAIVGGIMGGSAEGIKAMKEGRNFWTGELPRPTNNYSSLKLKDDFGIKINEPELLSTNEYPGPPAQLNNLNHIFSSKHNLEPLIKILGNQRNVLSTVLFASNGQFPSAGTFSANVNLYGYDIWIRGSVVNGIPKIGTMFIP